MPASDALAMAPAALTLAAVTYGLARRMRAGGPDVGRSFVRPSQAAHDSDGWRKDTFVMKGLEADGAALQEFTDEARMYGYRREQGDDRYWWRFVRERRG